VAVFGALLADQAAFPHGLHTSLPVTVVLPLATAAANLLLKARPTAVTVSSPETHHITRITHITKEAGR
jgi:hypothetical protein